ncbi:hypothetical protein HZA97_09785 [Candidatus Woesearchaeota archaeon]|nr:hypothetical protein [Candidatus Woesearchaeota archaeon]
MSRIFSSKKSVFLTILFLFVLSCTSDIFSGSEFTGSKGLNFYFDNNAPPAYVYEESAVPIRIFVENTGASNVVNGVYSLGIEEQYIKVDKKTDTINLKGKSLERPYGDQTQIIVEGKAKSVGSQEGINSVLSFSLCYPYETKANIITCIDSNPSSKEKKVCTVNPQSFSAGQAAPIGVTNIVPRMIIEKNGVRPQYIITIKNLDKGEIISSDYVNYFCTGKSIPTEQQNVIDVEVSLSDEKLVCNKNKLNLKDGSDELFCELQRIIPSVEGSYNSPLTVKLSYGYAQTITKKIRIESKN